MTYNVCVLLLVCPHFLKLISHLPTCTCTVYILLAVHFCSENIYICYLNKKKKNTFHLNSASSFILKNVLYKKNGRIYL